MGTACQAAAGTHACMHERVCTPMLTSSVSLSPRAVAAPVLQSPLSISVATEGPVVPVSPPVSHSSPVDHAWSYERAVSGAFAGPGPSSFAVGNACHVFAVSASPDRLISSREAGPGPSSAPECANPCNEDRRFKLSEIQAIERVLDRPFDIDACSNADGSNALVSTFCSPENPFQKFDCSGMHVWCNPVFRDALSILLHYFSCKSRAPTTTSAVFVLPKWKSSSWWPLVSHMQVLKEYGSGFFLFDAPAADGRRKPMPGTPWPVVVFYDPPQRAVEFNRVWRSFSCCGGSCCCSCGCGCGCAWGWGCCCASTLTWG